MDKLSKQHRLFVEAYDGDEIYAMRVAGYAGADSYLRSKATDLLKQPLIIEAIKDRSKYTLATKNAIATREERQALWTAIMKNQDPYHIEPKDANGLPRENIDPNIPLATRLKASELLGKSEADFVDRVESTVTHSISELIQQSYIDDTPIEAIEAAYTKAKEKPSISFEVEESLESLDDLI
jgi:hypothetical protein